MVRKVGLVASELMETVKNLLNDPKVWSTLDDVAVERYINDDTCFVVYRGSKVPKDVIPVEVVASTFVGDNLQLVDLDGVSEWRHTLTVTDFIWATNTEKDDIVEQIARICSLEAIKESLGDEVAMLHMRAIGAGMGIKHVRPLIKLADNPVKFELCVEFHISPELADTMINSTKRVCLR